MIIVLKPEISKTDEKRILKEIRKRGYEPHVMRGVASVAADPEYVDRVMEAQPQEESAEMAWTPFDTTGNVRGVREDGSCSRGSIRAAGFGQGRLQVRRH